MGYFTSVYISELLHRARAVYMYLHDRADKDGMLPGDGYHCQRAEAVLKHSQACLNRS